MKDDQHPTYVIMLCKRGTSMICANFSRNACGKNDKIFFFFFKLMNINVWIPQNFNYNETLIIFKFWWIFSSWKGGGFVDELVAAKVISQHMFFFTFSYFLDKNLWNKKDMVVLVKINGQMLHQSNIFAVVLTTQILKVLSVVPNIDQNYNQ